ncbi:helix-turn-helix domain-containing protein [Pusillimonas sp. T7-7]|uniref:helix-turn-helix domain-containing protein n=1 Tax=Pusillimonas sp. (strain T7-7) TaxID=1007105 RepID=UPI00350FDB87
MIELDSSITFVNQFAERLRQARNLRNLSQAKLAAACGLSQSAIANYENNIRKTPKHIFPLADALNVNPVWLGTGTGPMEPLPMSAESAYEVSDRSLPPRHGLWPFSTVSSEQYWSLPPGERNLIENTVASLIQSLQGKT